MDTQYAYLIGSLFFLVIWLILFIFKKQTRKEMLILSVVFLPVVPFLEYLHIKDYWMPDYVWGKSFGIEDFIFAFAFAGISSVIYQIIYRRRSEVISQYTAAATGKKKLIMQLIFFGSIVLMIFSFFHFMLAVNTVTALVIAFLFFGLYMVMQRRDLLINAIFSGLFMSLLFFLFYMVFFFRLYPDIVERWWNLSNLSGNMILGLPVEEVAWAFAFGFMFGPLYEFVYNIKLNNSKKNI